MITDEFWTIGDVVRKLRNDQGITMQKLSLGLCSAATFSRIEANERDMDMMMAEIVLGRLGYSPDKFEIYTGQEELERYELREEIQKKEKKGKFHEVIATAEQYEIKYRRNLTRLEEQFVSGCKGFAEWKLGELEKAEELVEQAVRITVPLDHGTWVENSVLSKKELELLGILAEIYRNLGKTTEAFQLEYQIFHHLDRNSGKKIRMVEIYVRKGKRLAEFFVKNHEIKSAYEICQKSLSLLKETKKLYGLPDMMEWKARCEEELEKSQMINEGTARTSFWRAYYLYGALGEKEEADRIKRYLKELGQWESI